MGFRLTVFTFCLLLFSGMLSAQDRQSFNFPTPPNPNSRTLPRPYDLDSLKLHKPTAKEARDEAERRMIESVSYVNDRTRNEEMLETCARILSDPSVRFEVRRKAQFTRLRTLARKDTRLAVEEGRRWIQEHPGEPDALIIRRGLVDGACQARVPLDWLRTLFEEIFTNYPPTEINVIESHAQLANTIENYAAFHNSKIMLLERDAQYTLVQEGIRELLKRKDLTSGDTGFLESWANNLENRKSGAQQTMVNPQEAEKRKAEILEEQRKRVEEAVASGLLREVKRPDGTVEHEVVINGQVQKPKPFNMEEFRKSYPLTSEGEGEDGAKQ